MQVVTNVSARKDSRSPNTCHGKVIQPSTTAKTTVQPRFARPTSDTATSTSRTHTHATSHAAATTPPQLQRARTVFSPTPQHTHHGAAAKRTGRLELGKFLSRLVDDVGKVLVVFDLQPLFLFCVPPLQREAPLNAKRQRETDLDRCQSQRFFNTHFLVAGLCGTNHRVGLGRKTRPAIRHGTRAGEDGRHQNHGAHTTPTHSGRSTENVRANAQHCERECTSERNSNSTLRAASQRRRDAGT
jgi:hypothetical protein